MSIPLRYGIEHTNRGPDGRSRFWWFVNPMNLGAPRMTAVEAHVDALRAGHVHGGVEADHLTGADLWGSYLYACGCLEETPDPAPYRAAIEKSIYDAALRHVALAGRKAA